MAINPGYFFREAERPDEGVSDSDDVETFEPICRKYIYGDEQQAADDAAYVLFDVMGVGPGQTLYVTASAFGDNEHDWEQAEPLGVSNADRHTA